MRKNVYLKKEQLYHPSKCNIECKFGPLFMNVANEGNNVLKISVMSSIMMYQ